MSGYTHDYSKTITEGLFVDDDHIENKNTIEAYNPREDKCAMKVEFEKYLMNKAEINDEGVAKRKQRRFEHADYLDQSFGPKLNQAEYEEYNR